MKFINSKFISVAILLIGCIPAFAQETDITVVDEVVAQINESVITLSQIKGEMKSAVDALVAQGKTRSEAETLVESKKGQLIANLINEELLLQKGKEVGAERNVGVRVNQEFLRRMKQAKLKTVEELYKAMREQGINPDEVRQAWRKQFTLESVWYNLVDQVVYWSATEKEVKDYFDKNQAKFFKPATITISEVFLSFAGRDQNAVREKAKQLVAQLRGGADFAKIALENSDRPNVATNLGKVVDPIKVPNLGKEFAGPLKALKVGEISDPIEIDIGMEIVRIDARTKAINSANFDEAAVRGEILNEKRPEARRKFVKELRDDAYIKIRKSYQALILPYLNEKDKKETATASK